MKETYIGIALIFLQTTLVFLVNALSAKDNPQEPLLLMGNLFPTNKNKLSLGIHLIEQEVSLQKSIEDNLNSAARKLKNTHLPHLRLTGLLCEKERLNDYSNALQRYLKSFIHSAQRETDTAAQSNRSSSSDTHTQQTILADSFSAFLKPIDSVCVIEQLFLLSLSLSLCVSFLFLFLIYIRTASSLRQKR